MRADESSQPDLWAKLATLNRRCRVRMERTGPVGAVRRWRIVLERNADVVATEHRRLKDALDMSVQSAESRGWL